MGSLIDTSIFIESERGRLDLDSHVAARNNDYIFMSVVTASELLHGVHRAKPEFGRQRSAAIEGWIERFTLLDIDLAIARTHALLFAELKTSGQIIGVRDQWIAASCLTLDLKLITANVREFRRVPRLVIENWSNDKHQQLT